MDRTLLIVDDEEGVRRALTRTLRADGYRLLTASSGEEGLKVLESESVQMVLSDHRMGALSGMQLLRQVHQRWPEVLRVLLTGHADLDMALEAINLGELYRFLTKPWEDLELRQAVRLGFERLELDLENQRLRATVVHQQKQLKKLEQQFPGIASVQRDADGAILIGELALD
jgi:DNA-binding NtrC family response regulator